MEVAAEFTPTELCILDVLSDAKRHRASELHDCRGCYGSVSNVWFHVSNLKRKLEPYGETIVCEYYRRRRYYRRVSLNLRDFGLPVKA